MSENQLKIIPSVSEILQELPADIGIPHQFVTALIQKQLEHYRKLAHKGKLIYSRPEIVKQLVEIASDHSSASLKNVINGTGVVLHTGLGRAPIDRQVLENILNRLAGYVNLELELSDGQRGDRNQHVAPILSALVGAEDSLMVNNNAAAVLLTLNTLAENREVIISRGQEVEIGGSFRIPDVIAKSHCTMVEVGTTNRTHLKDYTKAITADTAALLWAHTSNYVVSGFTAEVDLTDLVELGRKHDIPVIADLGSGALIDLQSSGLPSELQVSDILKKGVDVVAFSGDKLLGGPQAGLIVGRQSIIAEIHANPIYRAVRCDKFIIAIMENILRTYSGNTVNSTNLAHVLLTTSRDVLIKRGQDILDKLSTDKRNSLGIELKESLVEAGSGSLPVASIPSVALCFNPGQMTVTEVAARLRNGSDPVIGYIRDNRFFIDLKAVLPEQFPRLLAAVNNI